MDLMLLHGFLGCPKDWDGVIGHLGDGYKCYAPSLPRALDEFPAMLREHHLSQVSLVGYSMGGRIALQLKQEYPDLISDLVLLSAHPGLQSEGEKKERLKLDEAWAHKLQTLPLSEFLEEWYAQKLFEGFAYPKKRLAIDPQVHAELLTHYSLGKQPYLSPPKGTLLLYGEKDLKYQNLYTTLGQAVAITGCSHAIHLENPQGVAHAMDRFWNIHRH